MEKLYDFLIFVAQLRILKGSDVNRAFNSIKGKYVYSPFKHLFSREVYSPLNRATIE